MIQLKSLMEKTLGEYLSGSMLADNRTIGSLLVEKVVFYQKTQRLDLTLGAGNILSAQEYRDLKNYLSGYLKVPVSLLIHTEHPAVNMPELQNYVNELAHTDGSCSILKQATMCYEKNTGRVRFLYTNEADYTSGNRILSRIKTYFTEIGLPDLGAVAEWKQEISAEIPEADYSFLPPAPPAERKQDDFKKKKYYRAKKENYTEIKLKDATENMNEVQFVGEVFAMDERISKAKNTMIKLLSVYDGTNAMSVKCFEGRSFSREDLGMLKNGGRYRFYGSVSYDTFQQEMSFSAERFDEVEKEKRIDPAEHKRVELHMHSNMSEMDGVCEAKEIVDYAFELGHEGIVLTDHADVQSFVKAFNEAQALKKKNPDRSFKVGFGCEMNMVDEKLTVVRNGTDEPLQSAAYVCFDLETTGLSCYFDHIIEFGAVRMKNHMVVDRKQMFIRPPVSIPAFITNKTNITNEMVKHAPTFAEAIDEILEWIGNDVLVAHNATFDYFFLNEELRRIGRKPLANPVVDTLDLSRVVLKDRRVYRLGNVARNYHINYDEEDAHRADYDAEVLSTVFLCLLKDAEALGARTLNDLQETIQDDDSFKKVRRSHVNVLARNKEGLKALYELVTMSNTKTLAVTGKANSKSGAEITAEPRIFRSALSERRDNLLIGTSCQNNEVFELACNGDDARLEQAISWYDYVEIQPPGNYVTMIALGSIPSMDRLKKVLKRMIAAAVKLNKPVVADSDAHYCKPEEKVFRDVYIMSQGVGGVTHPLYIRDEELRMRTRNPDQHIFLTDEMKEAFAWLDDPQLIQELVVDNPKMIFNQLEEIRPVPDGTFPPHIEGSDEKLKAVCYQTMKDTYEFEGQIPHQVKDRLDRELNSIIGAGYYVNYYISHLLVKKSNADGYMVGSRGSVGSSFTATMSGITEVNPLQPHYLCPHCHYSEWMEDTNIKSGFDLPDKVCPHCGSIMKGDGHNIPFETFLGFHGDKVPDIDLNFSNEYQAKAHAFTKEVFGEDHVFRAGTIGTVAEKTAFGYVSGYCEKMNITNMSRAMKDYLAAGCQNVKRTTGQHPGGIIVIPEKYTAEDFTPVQYPANDPNSEWKTTHYDFHDIHDNVLKFDILGHVDPTAMRLLMNISETDPRTVPMNDPETLSLFYEDSALKADPRIYHQETGALGLPEFGTKNTRRTLEETRPHHFSDLVIISGLSHGTDVWAGNAEVLVQQGHPLDEVIGCRDDIMTYLLDKKLESIDAFKIMEAVRKGKGLTEDYERKMREHGVPDWYIDSCKKIKYMFPKAHAVAYVMMAVRIAWYKVHEPHNFYIQFLTLRCDAYEIETMTKGIEVVRARMHDIENRLDKKDKINPVSSKEKSLLGTLEVCEEMYARGYQIGMVDLYRSKATEFTIVEGDTHTIIPPFTVIDGLGTNVALSIVAAREQGEFLSCEDILKRTQLSSTMLDKLKGMGCLGSIPDTNQISLF